MMILNAQFVIHILLDIAFDAFLVLNLICVDLVSYPRGYWADVRLS